MPGYSIIAKPVGPRCNLNCAYCYYLEKTALFQHKGTPALMADQVLETYVKQMFLNAGSAPVEFAWQGGEPLLAGLDFFHKAFALQHKHAQGRPFFNTMQTNGTLLTDEWCACFAKNSVLVGLSLDGPAPLHNAFRVDAQGRGTFESVLAAAALLQKHGIDFNILATVNRKNADHPLAVYNLLKDVGQGFIQFVPLVERTPSTRARNMGLALELPPQSEKNDQHAPLTSWSVLPEQFGEFYVAIYDAWLSKDVGKVFVQLFDATLAGFLHAPSPVCYYAGSCGHAGVLEINGDVYACDHFVYPQFKRGNILETSLNTMLNSPEQRRFGQEKQSALPQFCRECEFSTVCNGECPKNRFTLSPEGEPGVNYLCSGYKRFFSHAAPSMRKMAHIVRNGGTADEIMR